MLIADSLSSTQMYKFWTVTLDTHRTILKEPLKFDPDDYSYDS